MGIKEIELRMNEMCDLLGISPQGIRLYEKHDAIHSFKYEGNGYRYYYFEDIAPAIQLRCMRKMGVPLAECSQGRSGRTLDEMEISLSACRSRIEENIRYEQALLERTQVLAQSIANAAAYVGEFGSCVRPALYYLSCERDGAIPTDADSRRLIQDWSAHLPFVRFCPAMRSQGLSEESAAQLGFCCHETDLAFAPEVNHPQVRFMPEQPCIGGVVHISRQTTDYYSVIEPGLAYLRKNGLELAGDILTEFIAAGVRKGDDVFDYYFAWYPFRSRESGE